MNIEELAYEIHAFQDLMQRAITKKVILSLSDIVGKNIQVLSAHNDYAIIRTIIPTSLEREGETLALPYGSHVGYKVA